MKMKRTFRYAIYLMVAIALQGCAEETGFVPLFNGRDLSGWVNVNGAPGTWTVRDGMIVCSGIPTGVLRTTEHYENFILELEWRHLHPGGNAGLFVYSDALPVRGQPFTRAVECQVMDGNHGDVFAIQGATMTPDRPHPQGWMRCLPSEERARPTGQWNHYRVESREGRLTLAVNGKVVSGGSQSVPRKGYIMLESEGSEVHFRNIRMKTLPSSDPPPAEVATVDEGFVSLYNGVDLTGWQVESRHVEHWTAQDWILDYDGQPTPRDRHLWSEKAYGDFVLIVDWRFTPQAETLQALDAGESGIFVRGRAESRITIWNRPMGSGGLLEQGDAEPISPELRARLTPKVRADRAPGQWNRFVITLAGNQLSVVLNDQTVIDQARVPQLPLRGPIALVDQGAPIQFANLYIKALP